MKYIISEVLNEAIMTKIPTIVVEGIDDVKIYDCIAKTVNKNYFVIPIECIDGFSEGNEHVIRAMNQVSILPSSKYGYENYIVGIIDKDVRDFRHDIPINRLIFPLTVYSIESHFVNNEAILLFISELTRATRDLINSDLERFITDKLLENFEDLYLMSLEALKGAIDKEYLAEFSYSFNEGRIIDIKNISSIRKKKTALLSFANDLGINYNLETLKRISKGKWLLFLFCYTLEKTINKLPEKCQEHKITSCRVCITDIKKCLYKIKDGITHKTLKSILMNKVDLNEFDYIRNKLNSMNP
ncbi:TPA: hypothetical protein ACPZRY_002212 [Yersinia enterocolitica]|nr:hypothetical protein [Yersinia kristensenii]EKN3726133.1 hypothetical protein [Yersinia enterocolitica]EKN4713796.1 hypothetical protein [Yersinia enterocolitica]EKN4809000.1 hypothetical protein [Yersinia enterocolitica]HDL7328381.1 hypothetical protein [Yersinia enterocolitica]HDL7958345.1 hypothetical protein [Yersinia enterocolitica]